MCHDANTRVTDYKVRDLVLFKVNKVPTSLSSRIYNKAVCPYRTEQLGPNFTCKLCKCSDKVNPSLINNRFENVS